MPENDKHKMIDDDEITERVANALEEEQKELSFIFRTSTGAIVEALETPTNLAQRIWAQFPEPKPPMIKRKDGSREWMEPNFNSPSFIAAQDERTIAVGEAMLKLQMLKAMKIHQLPEGVPPYEEDDTWEEELEAIGLSVPSKKQKTARYLEWLRYRIIPTSGDLSRLQMLGTRRSGVSEEEIDAAIDRFQRTHQWNADSTVAPTVGSGNAGTTGSGDTG